MPESLSTVALRVRLSDRRWRQFKERASLRPSESGLYADMAFRYSLTEAIRVQPTASMDDPDEEIYLELRVAEATKRRLAERSERERWNLATFSGLLLAAFLERFERDPRDLAMMHYLGSRLDEIELLSEAELRQAIARCERNPDLRLPPGYFARWLHTRLQSIVQTFHKDGTTAVPLTLQVIHELLEPPSSSSPS